MRLALVLKDGQTVLGILDRGLPPETGTADNPAESTIVLRNVAVVLYAPVPVRSELGGEGLGVGKLLEPLPLEDAPLIIEYGETAPWYKLYTVDPGNPPAEHFIRRYLALFQTAPSVTDGKPGGPVTEAERSGAGEPPRRVRLTS